MNLDHSEIGFSDHAWIALSLLPVQPIRAELRELGAGWAGFGYCTCDTFAKNLDGRADLIEIKVAVANHLH